MRIKITPIQPRNKMAEPEAISAAIERALDRNAAETLAEYQKVVATWDTEVNFTIHKTKYGRSVGTRNKIFGYVDQGTRPHPIPKVPKRDGVLRFQVGGTPKTKPKILNSYKGRQGNQWRSARQVQHPGTEARKFSAVITTHARQRQARYVNQELKKVLNGK